MAVQAYLYPGRQLIEGALTAHRAALPRRQLLVTARNARGTGIGRGLQTTRPWTVPTLALGLLRRLQLPWRRRVCRRDGRPIGIGFERGAGACPTAICWAGSRRFLR